MARPRGVRGYRRVDPALSLDRRYSACAVLGAKGQIGTAHAYLVGMTMIKMAILFAIHYRAIGVHVGVISFIEAALIIGLVCYAALHSIGLG